MFDSYIINAYNAQIVITRPFTMFFFTRIQFPKLSSTNYETQLEETLLKQYRNSSDNKIFIHQLALNKHVANIANSLHQLSGVSSSKVINLLNDEMEAALSYLLEHNTINNDTSLRNTFTQLQEELNADKTSKIYSALYMTANSVLFSISTLGIVACGAMMFTGPIGVALLGLGVTLLATTVMMLTAYSIYVDGAYLFDKQLNDIEKGIDFLIQYPRLVEGEGRELKSVVEDYDPYGLMLTQ